MLELRASLNNVVKGFSAKLDIGTVADWGNVNRNKVTEWIVVGGPIIGFHYESYRSDMSLIVGNKCRPKYFGARTLSVRLGKERKLKCYWQNSYSEYFSTCLSKGLA